MSVLSDAKNRRTVTSEFDSHPEAGPVLVNMADVVPANVKWLWPSRIPLGRLTLLIGVPGGGKSFLTADISARVSCGGYWPDGERAPLGDVILISAEDDASDTIRPRLDACGADVSRISLMNSFKQAGKGGKLEECPFTLADVDQLQITLEKKPDCRLVVIDPIGSFVGGKVDLHRDNEVRTVLGPLAMMASKRGFAALVVAHRRKATSSHADDLALGSRAFTGLARAAWHLTRDTEDKERRLLLSGKNNLAQEPDGLAFRIDGSPARIEWEANPVSLSANDALALENASAGKKSNGEERDRPSVAEAKLFLEEILAKAPLTSNEVKAKAKEAGISWRNIERAKEGIAESRKSGFDGGWKWYRIGTDYPDEGPHTSGSGKRGGLRESSETTRENTLFSANENDETKEVGGLRESTGENSDSDAEHYEDRHESQSLVVDREAAIAAALPPDALPVKQKRTRRSKT